MKSIAFDMRDKYCLGRDYVCEIIDEDCFSLDRAANKVISNAKINISSEASSLRPDNRLLFLDQLKDHFQNALLHVDGFFNDNILGFYSYLLHRHVFNIEERKRSISVLNELLPEVIKLIEDGELRLLPTGSATLYGSHLFFFNYNRISSAAYRVLSLKEFLSIVNNKEIAEVFFSKLFPLMPNKNYVEIRDLPERVKFCLVYPFRSSIGENTLRLFEETKKTEFADLQKNWERILKSIIEYIDNLQGKRTPKLEYDASSSSYRWVKDDITPHDLYHKLKEKGLISPKTREEDFVAVFSNRPRNEIQTKVQWEENISLFAYFFDKLTKDRFIPTVPKWINLEYFFSYHNKKECTYVPVPATCKVNIGPSKAPPVGFEKIDSIFKELNTSKEQSQ